MVIQHLCRAGSFRRLPAKVIFMPKYGIRARYHDVVWELLFDEVQAICFRNGKPGRLFWIDLNRSLLDLLLEQHGVPQPRIG